MFQLLNLFAAIALLMWGTYIVRTGMLRVFGQNLRVLLQRSFGNRFAAMLAGLTVTSAVQSATATCMIVGSFVAQGMITTGAALAAMLGADVGSAALAALFSFDLSWLSPALIVVGIWLFLKFEGKRAGRIGNVLIGLGLIMLALRLIVATTKPLTATPTVQALLVALPSDPLLHCAVGAAITMFAYSSMAVVLLTATLAGHDVLPAAGALGIVLGANIGSGLVAWLSAGRAGPEAQRLPLGNLAFKIFGTLVALPFLAEIQDALQGLVQGAGPQTVAFHVIFNAALAAIFIGLTRPAGKVIDRLLPSAARVSEDQPRHLDPVALSTPSLAIACAAREALRQADAVETMLRGIAPVLRTNDLALAERLRHMDDTVDSLYSAIKLYLTQVSREALSESEGQRWSEVLSFTINMEQIGDITERILQDLEDKKIRANRQLSEAGMSEVCHLHERLMANLSLAMSVFLHGRVSDAKRLLQEKTNFRVLEHEYAANHIGRLRSNTVQSIETSSLHLDLITELKRINSHICSLAYPVLETVGSPTRDEGTVMPVSPG